MNDLEDACAVQHKPLDMITFSRISFFITQQFNAQQFEKFFRTWLEFLTIFVK